MASRNRSGRLYGGDRRERKRLPGQGRANSVEVNDEEEEIDQLYSPPLMNLEKEIESVGRSNSKGHLKKTSNASNLVKIEEHSYPQLELGGTTEKLRTQDVRISQQIPRSNLVTSGQTQPEADVFYESEAFPSKPKQEKQISQVHKKVINYLLTGDQGNSDLEKIREARRKELEKARLEIERAKPKKKYIPPPPTIGTSNSKPNFEDGSVKSPRQKKNSKSSKESDSTPNIKPVGSKQEPPGGQVFRFEQKETKQPSVVAKTDKVKERPKLSQVEEERSLERSKSKHSIKDPEARTKKAQVPDPYMNDLVLPPPPARIPQVNIEVAPGVFNLQLILDTMNDIRMHPRAYVSRINSLYLDYITDKSYHKYFNVKYKEGKKAFLEAKVFLSRVKPVPALQLDDGLTAAAYLHSRYLSETNLLEHKSKDGTRPFERMLQYGSIGRAFKGGSENILRTPLPTPEDWLLDMVIDDGVATRGHRDNFFNEGGAVGIGVARKGKDVWLTLDYFMHGFTHSPQAVTSEVKKKSGLAHFYKKDKASEQKLEKQKRSEKSRDKLAVIDTDLPIVVEPPKPRKQAPKDQPPAETRIAEPEIPKTPKDAPLVSTPVQRKPTPVQTPKSPKSKQYLPAEPAKPLTPTKLTVQTLQEPVPTTEQTNQPVTEIPAPDVKTVEEPQAENPEFRKRRSTEILSETPD